MQRVQGVFSKPKESEYESYGAFALAALGFAVFSHGLAGDGLSDAVGVDGIGGVVGYTDGILRRAGIALQRSYVAEYVGPNGRSHCGGCGCVRGACDGVGRGAPVVDECDGVDGSEGRASDGVYRAGGVLGRGGTGASKSPWQLPRGPNYERNRLNRQRKKEAKAARGRENEDAKREELEFKRAALALKKEELAVRVKQAKARETMEELKLQRCLREEQARAAKYNAGLDHVAEALRLAKDARAASQLMDYGPVAKVAGWAATLCSTASNSIAKSAPNTVPSVGSETSASELAVRKAPHNKVESRLVSTHGADVKKIQSLRKKFGRQLLMDDVLGENAVFRLTVMEKKNFFNFVAGIPEEEGYQRYYD